MKNIHTPDSVYNFIEDYKCKLCKSNLYVDDKSWVLQFSEELESNAWCEKYPEHYLIRILFSKNKFSIITEELDFDYNEHHYFIENDPSGENYACIIDKEESLLFFIDKKHLDINNFSEKEIIKTIEAYKLLK